MSTWTFSRITGGFPIPGSPNMRISYIALIRSVYFPGATASDLAKFEVDPVASRVPDGVAANA